MERVCSRNSLPIRPLSPSPGMGGLEQGCGQGPDAAVTHPEALVPTGNSARLWCQSHSRLPQRWILNGDNPAREASSGKPWGSEAAGQCGHPRAAWWHPRSIPGVCLESCARIWLSVRGAKPPPAAARGRAQGMGIPGSADPSAALPTPTGKSSQHPALRQVHPKDAPRTPGSGPEAVLAAGSDQSPGQLGSDTSPRTESSILALTFPGDSWWLC